MTIKASKSSAVVIETMSTQGQGLLQALPLWVAAVALDVPTGLQRALTAQSRGDSQL